MLAIKPSRALQIRDENIVRNISNPNLLTIHAAMWPTVSTRDLQLYVYPSMKPQYWFLLKIQQNISPMVLVGQSDGSYDQSVFASAFKLFVEKSKIFENHIEIEFRTEAHLMSEIATFVAKMETYQSTDAEEYHLFYMTPEQMRNALQVECKLPYGFHLSNLLMEDADDMNPDKEKSTSSRQAFKKQIQYLPSSCARESSTGKVVAYELRSFAGTMTDQYTMPEHRRQGLGLAVEMSLSQKIIRLHEVPLKLVPSYMTSILYSTQESPFWTMWSRNTFPVRYLVQTFKHIA